MMTASTSPKTWQRWTHSIWLVARQILWRVPMLILVSLIVFCILRLIPVDPIKMLLPPGASNADIANLTHELGLDKNVLTQFAIWLQNALHLDFGLSIQTGTPVSRMVAEALPVTLELLFFGLCCGILIGLSSGLLTFVVRGTRLERFLLLCNGVMIAIPDYLWGILLIVVFGVILQWLPFIGPVAAHIQIEQITGFHTLDALLSGNREGFFSALSHLVLPALALGLATATPIARMMYSSLVDVYQEEYIHAAQLRGVAPHRVLYGHAVRNAILPTVSLIGVQTSVIIGSTLLVEAIYGLPGIGALMIKAMKSFDMQMIQAIALTYAVTVQAANILSDFAMFQLNPRLRSGS